MDGKASASGETMALKDDAKPEWIISVMKCNGDMVQCSVASDSIVMDLVAAVKNIGFIVDVDPAFTGDLEPILLSQSGEIMHPHACLSYYNVGHGSTVTVVRNRKVKGHYCCYLEIDPISNPARIDIVKFDLEIKECCSVLGGYSATINGIEGTMQESDSKENCFNVTLKKPLRIRSMLPQSRAFFDATGCELELRNGDFSNAWWFSLEGKMLGRSSHPHAGRFKARRKGDVASAKPHAENLI